MTEPKQFTKLQALEAMRDYFRLGREEKNIKGLRDLHGRVLREYLKMNGATLSDDEQSLEAYLQQREGSPAWDLSKTPAALILWAQEKGLLTVDNKFYEAMLGKFIEADDLKRFRMPGRPSEALIVQKKEAT